MKPAPSATRPPWQWACLGCNATWVGTSPHRCADAVDYRRNFWRRRLAFAPVNANEILALVDQPIARADLASLLGPSWLATGDIQ